MYFAFFGAYQMSDDSLMSAGPSNGVGVSVMGISASAERLREQRNAIANATAKHTSKTAAAMPSFALSDSALGAAVVGDTVGVALDVLDSGDDDVDGGDPLAMRDGRLDTTHAVEGMTRLMPCTVPCSSSMA